MFRAGCADRVWNDERKRFRVAYWREAWELRPLVLRDPSRPPQMRYRISPTTALCSLRLWPFGDKSGNAPRYPLPRRTLRAGNRIALGHPRSGPAESTRSSSYYARRAADPMPALGGTRRWPSHIFFRRSSIGKVAVEDGHVTTNCDRLLIRLDGPAVLLPLIPNCPDVVLRIGIGRINLRRTFVILQRRRQGCLLVHRNSEFIQIHGFRGF